MYSPWRSLHLNIKIFTQYWKSSCIRFWKSLFTLSSRFSHFQILTSCGSIWFWKPNWKLLDAMSSQYSGCNLTWLFRTLWITRSYTKRNRLVHFPDKASKTCSFANPVIVFSSLIYEDSQNLPNICWLHDFLRVPVCIDRTLRMSKRTIVIVLI